MTIVDAAIRLADAGYRIFPCQRNGKTPLTPHGCRDATSDVDQVAAWWTRWPTANIGLSTDDLLALDIDGASNPWPSEATRQADLARAPINLTPGGGRHHLFRQPQGRAWGNTVEKLAPHVDSRGNGGYILVPPSVVAERPYAWAEGCEGYSDGPRGLPLPPDWLVAALDAPLSASSEPLQPGNDIPHGARNDTLARLAGHMRRAGMTNREILAALTTANGDRCKPPLPDKEIQTIAWSISRYEPDQITVANIECHYEQDHTEPPPPQETIYEDPGIIPEILFDVPGFINELMVYTLETAPYPNPAMAFSGALALQAFLIGRKLRDPQDVRSNVYLLGLAHSAAGKDHPRKVNSAIVHEIGLETGIHDRFASGEGIQDALAMAPASLFQSDEIDGLLRQVNGARDARHEGIMSTLLTVYSSSNSIYKLRRRAGIDQGRSVNQPCLVLFGTAIPKHYYDSMSERMLTNGLFSRMVIVEAGARSPGQESEIIAPPPRILETASYWAKLTPGTGNMAEQNPDPRVVPLEPRARALLREVRTEAEERYRDAEHRGDDVGTTVWGRVYEQTRKFALLYAASESPRSPIITPRGVAWAAEFCFHQTRRMLYMAQVHVADSPFHKDCLRALRKVEAAPRQVLAHGVLLKRMKLDARAFGVVISTLHQWGELTTSRGELTTGKSGTFYHIAGSEPKKRVNLG